VSGAFDGPARVGRGALAGVRVRRGQQDIENVDTAAIEAAIKDLDVYGSDSVIRGVLADVADTEGA